MKYSDRQLGDKLLPKIVHAVSQAVISTKRGLAPLDHHVRVKATWDVFSKIGEELADHYGPIIDQILAQDTSSVNPAVVQWLKDARSGTDQAKAISGILVGAGQSAIGTFLSNELAPMVRAVVETNPNLDLDVSIEAQAVAAGLRTVGDAQKVGAGQGYSPFNVSTLIALAEQWPGTADALDMVRRQLITQQELDTILQRSGMPESIRAQYASLQVNELSLADAGLAYLRSDIDLAEAQRIAHANGFTDEQLNVFIGNIGEPPAAEQLGMALRRQFIDNATFERGIKQSRIRNEWIPLMLKLIHAPMSVADAVNAVVQNHLDMAAGRVIADQNGLEAGQFDILYATAGEPLSRTELEQLYNRGEVDQATVEQGLRESRLKNKYVADAFKLHVRLLEPRMLASAVEYGAVTHDAAVKRALEQGFSQADAEILVSEGSLRKMYTRRQAVLSSAETLYEDNAISEAELRAVAKTAGLDATEADEVVKMAEYRREARWVNSVITVIRSKYVAHHIDRTQATAYLDALGVPAARRDQLLAIWDMERAANTKQLTEAQIAKAVKLQLITAADGLARLLEAGYSQGDAQLLLEGA